MIAMTTSSSTSVKPSRVAAPVRDAIASFEETRLRGRRGDLAAPTFSISIRGAGRGRIVGRAPSGRGWWYARRRPFLARCCRTPVARSRAELQSPYQPRVIISIIKNQSYTQSIRFTWRLKARPGCRSERHPWRRKRHAGGSVAAPPAARPASFCRSSRRSRVPTAAPLPSRWATACGRATAASFTPSSRSPAAASPTAPPRSTFSILKRTIAAPGSTPSTAPAAARGGRPAPGGAGGRGGARRRRPAVGAAERRERPARRPAPRAAAGSDRAAAVRDRNGSPQGPVCHGRPPARHPPHHAAQKARRVRHQRRPIAVTQRSRSARGTCVDAPPRRDHIIDGCFSG